MSQPYQPQGHESNKSDTQPRRPTDFPQQVPENYAPYAQPNVIPPDDENNGPGCFVWFLVSSFSIFLAVVVVIMAMLAGWSQGIDVAQANATSTRNVDIQTQCEFLARDLANGNLSLAERRFDDLILATPAIPCVIQFAPTATALYFENLPTTTPTPLPPTATATMTATPIVTVAPATAIPTLADTNITTPVQSQSSSGGVQINFDLDGLLVEARTAISEQRYTDAIDTLDAIIAIDIDFQKGTVDNLLFTALTSEARFLYITGGNLAQANLLVTRAEEFGDVGDLSYERFIAQLYLEAQGYRNINYPLAIQSLNQIVITQGLTNYRDASTQLVDQYVKYGDSLVEGFDFCLAETQFNAALQLTTDVEITTKRNNASEECRTQNLFGTATPSDGTGTIAPIDGTPPTIAPTATQGIAPVGVQGG